MYKEINIKSLPPEVSQNIRAEMVRVGLTNKAVADIAGKDPTCVSRNIRGIQNTPEIRRIICEKTGKTEAELWGIAPDPIMEEKKRVSA